MSYRSAVFAVVMCLSVSLRPSVRHKPVLYRNDWTNQTGTWHGGFLPSLLYYVVRKFGFLKNRGTCTFFWNFIPNSGLIKFRHESRLVDHVVKKTSRRSSLLTTLATVDASWLFTTRPSTVML